MLRRKHRFETVPLNKVPKVDAEGNVRPANSGMTSSRKNDEAQPERDIRMEGDDHPFGLWINRDLLRRHQNRTPQVMIHGPLNSASNRYLALADFALGNDKPRTRKKPQVESSEAGGVMNPRDVRPKWVK